MKSAEDKVAEKFLAGMETHFATRARLKSAMKVVGEVVLKRVFKPLSERVQAAERRLAELELRPTFRYRGVWREGEQYSVGDFVTQGGSLWHCNAAHTAETRPGGTAQFTLAVKHGSAAS